MSRAVERERLVAEIEALMEERTGRSCLLLPSGRLAVYCALVHLLPPGGRLLMSPVTDDVIAFVVLAAGLRPVAAPLRAADGSIDVEAVPPETWASVDGVMTSNLYGLPDRADLIAERCAELGIPLIEDAAHAISCEVAGRPVGTFGAMSCFSLSKHVAAGHGGVLALAEASDRGAIEELRARLVVARGITRTARDVTLPAVKGALDAARLLGAARRMRRALVRPPRAGDRMDLRPEELRPAVAAGRGLGPFDPWTRVDRHDYLQTSRLRQLVGMLEGIRGLPEDAERRIAALERVREERPELLAPAAAEGPATPLFRIPLLVSARAAARAELERLGLDVHYVYDPPLDDYATEEFVTASHAPAAARLWSRHVLPIDPADVATVLGALRKARPVPQAVPA